MLLPWDLDACFEDYGGVHEAAGGAVTSRTAATVIANVYVIESK